MPLRCRAVADLATVAVDWLQAGHAVVGAEAPHGPLRGEQAREPRPCHPPAEIDSTPLVLRYTLVGVFRFAVLPLPSSPEPLLPQHFAPPAVVTAQVWLYPAEIDPTLLSPDTLTGCLRDLVVPSPSSPVALLPQHFTLPLFSSAQVWSCPPRRLRRGPESPDTGTGFRASVCEPLPTHRASCCPST